MFVSPMLARATEEVALENRDWSGWVLEPKHDGMRAIISVTDDGVEIYSRTGKYQKGKCPHLETSLAGLPTGTVLDGEIALVVNTKTIRDKNVPVVDFNKTMRIMGSSAPEAVRKQDEYGKVVFLLFDVISYGHTDLSERSQHARFDTADRIEANWLMHNPRYYLDFAGVYQDLIDAGIEGAILKRIDVPYEVGKRSRGWLKVKSEKTFDVVVMGFTNGQGKYEGQIGAIEFGAYDDDGQLTYVGRCSGMTDEERKSFTTMRDAWDKMVLKPQVIEVKANEMVGSGEYRTPRHPQYMCVRLDKNSEDCKMDQFKA